MKYNFSNFCCSTFADYTQCENPHKPPNYYSESGSIYWDLEDRVVRYSDHWCSSIGSCHWYINSKICTEFRYGYCLYSKFKPASYKEEWLVLKYQEWL